MTKNIRVENACGSDFRVIDGVPQPDSRVVTYPLDRPTAMTPKELYITDTRYLMVKEAPAK